MRERRKQCTGSGELIAGILLTWLLRRWREHVVRFQAVTAPTGRTGPHVIVTFTRGVVLARASRAFPTAR